MSDQLTGTHVLVTRPSHQADKLVGLIESHGGTALRFPTLQIEGHEDREAIAAAIGDISEYDIAIFISFNAVNHGAQYLPTTGKRPLLAAIGPSTARALKDSGFTTDIKATRGFTSEALLREPQLQDVADKKVIIFRGSGGRALLGRELEQRGAAVTYAEVYRRDRPDVLDAEIESKLAAGSIDMITATSAETLVNLYELAEEPAIAGLLDTQLVTTSERVVKKAAALGFKKQALLAAGPDDQAIVDAILEWRATKEAPAPGAGTRMTEPLEQKSTASDPAESEPIVEVVEEHVEEETVAVEPEPAPAAAAPVRRGGGALGLLAMLFSLAALTAAGYLWWEQQKGIEASAQTQSETGGVLASARQDIAALDGRVGESLSRVSGLDAARNRIESNLDELRRNIEMLSSRVQAAEQSIDDVRGVSAAARTNWVRAEAEYYMQVANSRLQLARDPDAALAALLAADDRLKSLGDPTLYRVRQEVASEVAALKAVPRPDVEGMALTLSGLAARVDELPLHNAAPGSYESTVPTEIEAEKPLDRAISTLGGVFTSMISVKRTDEAATPLLSRDEEFFLKRNLELQLHTARLALLDGDAVNYTESLRTARNWLQSHFKADAAAVQGVINSLAELETQEIAPAMPDISGSLRLLRITAPAVESSTVPVPAEETAPATGDDGPEPAEATPESAEATPEPAEATPEPAEAAPPAAEIDTGETA